MTAKMSTKLTRTPLTDEELEKLTADDFLKLKLTGDEKTRLREINQAKACRRAEQSVAVRAEEAPILADLRAVGSNLKSVWDLVNTSGRYPDAVPVLLKHLPQPYSDRTKEGIARALAVSEAKYAWPLLVEEYCKAPVGEKDGVRFGAKSGLAAALAATATDDVIGELIVLAKDQSHGSSRLLLLRALRRSKAVAAKQILEELASDPALSKEISSWKRMK